MNRPVVVLDAAGTLLEVAGSVGEAYAEEARASGAELDPLAIERGFGRAMRAAPPLAFGHLSPAGRRAAARGWWRSVAGAAIAGAGDLPPDFAFETFFDRAWERFSRSEAWRVHDDVRPALRAFRARGFPLAVFSNWDERLEPLLKRLGLAGWFCHVIASSDLRAAKPARAAFDAAAGRLANVEAGLLPPIMIGDRVDHDIMPAIEAGWTAVWLDREGRGPAPGGVPVVRDLREASGVLG
jgi:REG-2-like HAD superfamily hydrolase